MKIESRPDQMKTEPFEQLWNRFVEKIRAADTVRPADEARLLDVIEDEEWLIAKVEDLKNWMREASKGP